MKAKTLIEMLGELKNDDEVYFSKDEEGNAFHGKVMLRDCETEEGTMVKVLFPADFPSRSLVCKVRAER